MFHQQMSSALRSSFLSFSTTQSRLQNPSPARPAEPPAPSLRLVESPSAAVLPFPQQASLAKESPRLFADILSAASKRFAAFCAEAAVLVFVLGILDRFLIKERIEPAWITGAFVLSLVLLAVSVATDVAARRCLAANRG